MALGDPFRIFRSPVAQAQSTPKPAAPKPANAAFKPPFAADTFGPPAPVRAAVTPGSSAPLSAKTDGSVSVKPEEVSATVKGEVKGPKGISASFEASIKAENKSNVESKDGYTTYTVETDLSVSVSGNVDAGVVGFGASHTSGVRSTYQVRMSDEDYARLQAGEIPEPDPFNPETMPEGSSIVMNSADYENNGFNAAYKKIKLDSNVEQSQGASTVIEKGADNAITVTTGPTQAVENSWKLGLSLGPASVHIGNKTNLEGFTLNTATFDLDTPEGQGAYAEFLVTGEMPKDNGTGIKDVAKVEKLDFNSTSSAGFDLGPFSGSVEIGSSSLNQVVTTFPDGTKTQVSDFSIHPGDIPIHLERSFNADGTEDLSKQQFTMTLADVDDAVGAYIYTAFTGADYETAKAQFKGDKDLVLTLNAENSAAIAQRAQDYITAWEHASGQDWEKSSHLGTSGVIDQIAKAKDAAELAVIIGKVFGGDGAVAEALLQVMIGFGRDSTPTPLPGTVEAQ